MTHKGYKQTKEHKDKEKGLHFGEKAGMWKGDNAKYSALHIWVRNNKPKPKFCEECKKEKKLTIACISEKYTRNFEDYKWFCYSCHGKMDKKKDICRKGHKLEGNNLIINNRGHRSCRECKKKNDRKYYKNKNERKNIKMRKL